MTTCDQLFLGPNTDYCVRHMQQLVAKHSGLADAYAVIIDRRSKTGAAFFQVVMTDNEKQRVGGDRYLAMMVSAFCVMDYMVGAGMNANALLAPLSKQKRMLHARVFALGEPSLDYPDGVAVAVLNPPDGGWATDIEKPPGMLDLFTEESGLNKFFSLQDLLIAAIELCDAGPLQTSVALTHTLGLLVAKTATNADDVTVKSHAAHTAILATAQKLFQDPS